MPDLATIPVIFRELLSKRSFPREPEPDLIMDTHDNVDAYADSGSMAGEMAANYLFHTEQICQTLKHCKTVIDLACGPATILSLVAELNPGIHFIGIDLSQPMLEKAKALIDQKKLTNVRFEQCDITRLEKHKDHSIDGIISTMALHHLPAKDQLSRCFHEINRVLVQNGALYLADFTRLKDLKSVLYFAYRDKKIPPLFALDYERSLRAAFHLEDFQELVGQHFAENIHLHHTFLLKVMMIIKTQGYPVDTRVKNHLAKLKRGLDFKFRMVYREICLYFFLGGLK